jgi:spore maturation protein CgeB
LGSVFGLEMFEKIAQSKIVFNKHINHVGKAAANIRLFEVTGAGSCLLTDHKDNLSDYFDIDNEIVTYKSKEELISKAKYLLLNENERKKIAKAGQDRTLKDHNYSARFDQFSNYLLSII